ncbi:MAG: Ig-like domain-containing protein [Defluviitaleaceae bacterium]|nr:Ig-like domain-containing protein [Defluviitaleaceae bacterium]
MKIRNLSLRLLMIILLTTALALLMAACSRTQEGEYEAESPPETPVLDMTQMPLYIEGAADSRANMPVVMPLAWHDIFEIPKEGYTLVPEVFGAAGVDVSSAFVLTIPYGAPAGYTPAISIDGQPLPVVTHIDDGNFLVEPVSALGHNRLYIFRLLQDGAEDITWAIQTAAQFQITSTLPRHESVNVPVNTGIEINFSSRGHTDIREHFSIYPAVEGRFIQRGALTVFMPTNPLQQGQLYTVTITAGIGLPGTNEIINEDFVFSFETADDDPQRQNQHTDSVHFASVYTEYPSFEPPHINFRVNYQWGGTRPVVNIDVYRFSDNEQAVDAVHDLLAVPRWTWFAWRESFVDVSRLTRIADMVITESQTQDSWSWFETFHLPDALPPGFYIINASINNEISDQMILQVTDLAVQIFADQDTTLIWVNDMTTGQPVTGAQVHDTQRSGETDANGIVTLSGGMSDANDMLIVTAPDGKRCIIFYARYTGLHHPWGGWWGSPQPSDAYWTALQLDRTLFQRSDSLHFWGFAQNRERNEEINYITAVLTQGWGFGWSNARDTLHRQTFNVRGGAYTGEIALPNLDPGSYWLTIYHGDIVLGSVFFEVQDFVKPPYQMIVSADRRAAFVGESVTFTARTEFFEGTPVPELDVSYSLWGWQLRHDIWARNGTTDIDGEMEVTIAQINPDANAQGQTSLFFNAEATLPEIGWTHRSASVQVFVNDIDVQVRASRTGEDANISVNVHTITLDRLNDGTAEHSGDFLDRPVAGQSLPVEIVRVYWVPVRIGERYCFIERVVVPRYRHDRREEVIQRFNLTTGANGEATRDFTVPNRDGESYIARMSTTDGNGRRISHEVFIGRDWWNFFMNAESGEPFLEGGRPWGEGYDIGEEVTLTVMSGTEVLDRGNFLFVIASGGILEYRVGVNPLTFTFDDEHLPNATVYAVHFNGHTYHSGWGMRETLRFNSNSRELVLDITADQDVYTPSGTATITIRATDTSGNPKQAYINIAAVDEALFALRDYAVETLFNLYRNIPSGVQHNIATHATFASDGHDDMVLPLTGGWGGARDMQMDSDDAFFAAEEAEAGEPSAMRYGAGGETHIREIFEDTAIFAAIRTNAQGVATFSFRLPDNITSWRLTVSGISDDLYAGNDVSNIRVTNPMFVHYSINNVFLVGDEPTLGVNAFGTSLAAGESVTFEVWDYAAPDIVITAEGTAFERVNIPLWEMVEEGAHSIIIRAITQGGLSDAVRHNFQVIDSHRMMDVAEVYDVTQNTTFEAGRDGLTRITFTDRGRSQFLWDLMGMRWVRGARIEGLVMRREANRLIRQYFPDISLYVGEDSFNPQDYQLPNGGIAMLPHADSDLAVTVRLMPFIMDEINVHSLRNYLYNIFEGDNAENRTRALYGLAMLHEPVLMDLHNYAMVEDLPVQDVAYIALGFVALGEMHMAQTLYSSRILPYIQQISPYYRVYVGTTRSDILEATSIVALLAAQLNMPERIGLHQYTLLHHTNNLLVNIQQLSFITHEIQHVNDQPASITYTLFGEEVTRDLSLGQSFTLRIPAQNLHEFNLTNVVGDVGAVSIHRVPLAEVEIVDADITVTRSFFRAGENTARTTFDQGDLVRVQITIDYSRRALTGSYKITDFLPAGLVHVPASARFGSNDGTPGQWRHVTAEGQRVIFYDFNGRFDRVRTYYYYARVVSPGTFRAEGLIIQNLGVLDYLTIGEDDVITILG